MYVCIHEIIGVIIMKMKMKIKIDTTKSDHIDTTKLDLSIVIDTNKVNIKRL